MHKEPSFRENLVHVYFYIKKYFYENAPQKPQNLKKVQRKSSALCA